MKRTIPTSVAQAILLLILPVIIISPVFLIFRDYITNELFEILFIFLYTFTILLVVWIKNGSFAYTKISGILDGEKAKTAKNTLFLLAIISIIVIRFGINIKNLSFRTPTDSIPYHAPSYLLFFSAVLFGPILEEVIFRKIILTGLLSRYSPFKAIIYTSLLFGCMHYHPIQSIVQAFFAGIILSIVFYASGKLWICILFHSFANILGFAFSYLRSIPKLQFLHNNDYKIISSILCSILIVYLIKRMYDILSLSTSKKGVNERR
jgi:CAAX amino terminal protease family.